MTSNQVRVLIVEDDPNFARLLDETLALAETTDFRVTLARRLSDAFSLCRDQRFDLILLDLGLPDSQGLDTVILARGISPGTAIVVLTGQDDNRLGLDAVKQGAQDFMVKGNTERKSMERSLLYAIERQRSQEELKLSLEEKEKQLSELLAVFQRSNMGRTPEIPASRFNKTPTVGERILQFIRQQPHGADFQMIEEESGITGQFVVAELAKLMDAGAIKREFPMFIAVEESGILT